MVIRNRKKEYAKSKIDKKQKSILKEKVRHSFLKLKNVKNRREVSLNIQKDPGIYLCVRDIDGLPLGNHHFFMIIGNKNLKLFGNQIMKEEEGIYFCTFGGFPGKYLTERINYASDVMSVREGLNPELLQWWRADYDFESHRVNELNENDFDKILDAFNIYFINQRNNNVPEYNMNKANCITWCNSFLKSLDIPEEKIKNYRNFTGVNWSDKEIFDTIYFKEVINK